MVVEDEQRPRLVAPVAGDRGGGEQLVAAGLLVAQLHDVDAAGERRAQHVGQGTAARAQVAHEVQPGGAQPRASVVEDGHLRHCGDPATSRWSGRRPSTLKGIREPAHAG
jgi:hypothetical protein